MTKARFDPVRAQVLHIGVITAFQFLFRIEEVEVWGLRVSPGLAAQLGLSGQLQNYSRGPGSLQLSTAASGSAGIVTPRHQKSFPG